MKYTTAILLFAASVSASIATDAWTVAADAPNGVYSVHYDSASKENVHTFLRPLGDDNTESVKKATTLRYSRNRARGAAINGDIYCGGVHLNEGDTDAANNALDAQCGTGAPVTPEENGRDFYSISNGVVAYYCNTSGQWNHCSAAERQESSRRVTDRCGWYWSGDLTSPSWGNTQSVYGYQPRDSKFCGRGTNGRVEN